MALPSTCTIQFRCETWRIKVLNSQQHPSKNRHLANQETFESPHTLMHPSGQIALDAANTPNYHSSWLQNRSSKPFHTCGECPSPAWHSINHLSRITAVQLLHSRALSEASQTSIGFQVRRYFAVVAPDCDMPL